MASAMGGQELLAGVHRSNLYRKSLKENDPVKYRQYLDKQKKRAKEKREKLKRELKKANPDAIQEKKRILSLQRKRQEKYENRKKENGTCVKRTQKEKEIIETRAKIQHRKDYNRQAKRDERNKMSYQKKEWVKRKDRERKRKARESKKKLEAGDSCDSTPFRTRKTEWNITSKVRKTLPNSPRKFATILHNVIKNSSPRKKNEVEKVIGEDVHVPEKSIKEMKKTTSGKQALKIVARSLLNKCVKHLSKRKIAAKLKVDRRSLTKKNKDFRKRKSQEINNLIKNFYKRSDVSRVLPAKRYATKEGPGYLMQISIKEAHAKFNFESTIKVGFGRFATKRPRNVRKLSEKYREYCCCVYCMNIRNKILILDRCCPKNKKVCSEEKLLNVLLCPKSDNEKFFKKKCVDRECSLCEKFEETLKSYYNDIPEEKNFTWVRWEYSNKTETKHKRILQTKAGPKSTIIKELIQDVVQPTQGTSFVSHIHTAKWQNYQFSLVKDRLPEKTILQVVDFAKNRNIKYQEEIKSVFYTVEQITMYPVVSYYNTQQGIVREASIVISDDLNHDYHAVECFQERVYEDLSNRIGIPDKTILFSDGCGAQFKSRGPFGVLAAMDRKVNRNFYGSEHGKGDCDAEIGVVNRALDRVITGQKVVINNALDMYLYCHEHLENDDCLSKRKFFFIPKSEIQRKENKTNTVTGTRKLHQIINNTKDSSTLLVRNLSCFCESCEMGNQTSCPNKEFVAPFKEISLTSKKKQANSKKRKKNADDNEEKSPEEKKLIVNKAKRSRLQRKDTSPDNHDQGKQTEENSKQTTKNADDNGQKSLEKKKLIVNKAKRSRLQRKDTSRDRSMNKAKIGRQRKDTPPDNQTCDQAKREPINMNSKEVNKENIPVKRNFLSQEKTPETNFVKIMNEFEKCITYEELRCQVYSYRKNVKVIDSCTRPSIIQNKFTIDKIASNLIPSDLDASVYPARVGADGNCLPRAVSALLYGSEEQHREMRVRIVMELALNEDRYLDYNHLKRGTSFSDHEAKKLPGIYACFSPSYTFGDILTEHSIRRIFQQEVLEVSRQGSFMGIWQLFAAASVMNCSVNSVYPQRGNPSVREDLNRKIMPIGAAKHEVFIMWTTTREDMGSSHWIPNHFVPLLPLEIPIELVYDSYPEEENEMEISGLSGILETLENDTLEDVDQLPLLDFPDVTLMSMMGKPPPSTSFNALRQDIPDVEHQVKVDVHTRAVQCLNNEDIQLPSHIDDRPPYGVAVCSPVPDVVHSPTTVDTQLSSAIDDRHTDGFDVQPPVQSPTTVDTQLSSNAQDQPLDRVDAQSPVPDVVQSPRSVDTQLSSTLDDQPSDGIDVQTSFNALRQDIPDVEHQVKVDVHTHAVQCLNNEDIQLPSHIDDRPPYGVAVCSPVPDVVHSPTTVDTQLSSAIDDRHTDGFDVQPPVQSPTTVDTQLSSNAQDQPLDRVDAQSPVPDVVQSPRSVDTQLSSTLDDQPSDGIDVQTSYKSGQFLKIAHGTSILPAVVDDWPYIRFYYNKRGKWQEGDIRHTIVLEDVVGELSPPDIVMKGSRIFYIFKDL